MYRNREPLDPGEENMAEKISGNAFTCLNTVFLIGSIALLAVVQSVWGKGDQQENLIGLAAAALFLYPITGIQMFYFKVSPAHLIVKNHYLPWITWYYKLEDLSKISISRNGRMSKALFIFIKGHRLYRFFPAGSLMRRDWAVLKERLELAGSVVKD